MGPEEVCWPGRYTKEFEMEISGINSFMPFQFSKTEKDGQNGAAQQLADMVDVHAPELLADDEVEGVLADSIGMIADNPLAALSLHNLSENRVFALLGA